jgi:hypothetical protein
VQVLTLPLKQKKVAQLFGLFLSFSKRAQSSQSTNRRKFAQSGHTVLRPPEDPSAENNLISEFFFARGAEQLVRDLFEFRLFFIQLSLNRSS